MPRKHVHLRPWTSVSQCCVPHTRDAPLCLLQQRLLSAKQYLLPLCSGAVPVRQLSRVPPAPLVAEANGRMKKASGVRTSCGPGRWSNLVGATSEIICTACDAGRYAAHQVAVSISNCSARARGEYQPVMGASNCLICGGGRYTNSTASADCLLCPRGKTLEASGPQPRHMTVQMINDCPVLTYSPFLGHGEVCYPCLTAKTTGSTECAGCNPSKYSIRVGGNDTCVACPPGASRRRGIRRRAVCAKGYFTAENTSSTCRPCPRGKHGSSVGAKNEVPAAKNAPRHVFGHGRRRK